jgi:tRNA(fMet)-specific endonuclease VapC
MPAPLVRCGRACSAPARLQRAGTPIGAYDAMIAGQALRRGLTVITADADAFGRVDDLMWEDWAG